MKFSASSRATLVRAVKLLTLLRPLPSTLRARQGAAAARAERQSGDAEIRNGMASAAA